MHIRTIHCVPFPGLGLKLLTSFLSVSVSSLSLWIESRYGKDLASTTYIMMNDSWMMLMWERNPLPCCLTQRTVGSLLKCFSPHSKEYIIQWSKIRPRGLPVPVRSPPTTALWPGRGGGALEGSLRDAEHAQLQQGRKSSSEISAARTPADLQEKYLLKQETD